MKFSLYHRRWYNNSAGLSVCENRYIVRIIREVDILVVVTTESRKINRSHSLNRLETGVIIGELGGDCR
jgi:hypothetical protein